jgi:hypothetical protein
MMSASRSIGETDMATTSMGLLWYSRTRGLQISCAKEAEILTRHLGDNLFQRLGVEFGECVVFDREAYFDGMAANFAIFNVSLSRDGRVQEHGDFFAAVGTLECMFHIQTVQ